MPLSARDQQHLSLLSGLHYAYAAIVAFVSSCGLALVAFGIAAAARPDWFHKDPPPFWAAMLILAMGAIVVLSGWAWAICTWIAGRSLRRRRRYTFCIVVAAVNCSWVPLGTLLGVFTILVLVRSGVKAEFEGAVAPQ